MEIISYSDYTNMSDTEQQSIFNKYRSGKISKQNNKKFYNISPNWLPALYCIIPFPNFETTKLTVKINDNNILSGTLDLSDTYSTDTKYSAHLEWNGYVSQIYDGQLYMVVVNDDVKIVGHVNNIKIAFDKDRMLEYAWPGFLLISNNNK